MKSQLVIDLQRLQIFYTRNNIKQADTLLKQVKINVKKLKYNFDKLQKFKIINNSNITGELLKSTIEDNIEKIELNSYIDLNAILELKKVNSDNNASEINVNDTENKNNSLITSLMDSTTGIVKQYQIKKQGSKNYYLCNYCKKEFGKPSDLIRHVRTHTLEKPFKCEICSTCFTVKSTLNAHMKIHDQHSGNSKKIRNYLMSSEDGKEKEAEKCTKQKETCETSVESSLNYEIDESQSDDGDEFKTELISIQPNLLRPSLSRVHDNDLKEII